VVISASDECVPNIGPAGRARRGVGGAVTLAIGAVLAVVLVAGDAAWTWRLALLPLFWGGALGVLQAYFHT